MSAWPTSPHPAAAFSSAWRTLFIGVTLLAVPLGFVGWQAKIVRDRNAACDEIILGGGGVLRADEGALPWVLTKGPRLLNSVPAALDGRPPDFLDRL
jgi:hypothetical protein